MKIKIVSDGHAHNTHVEDVETGKNIRGVTKLNIDIKDASSDVVAVLTFEHIEIEVVGKFNPDGSKVTKNVHFYSGETETTEMDFVDVAKQCLMDGTIQLSQEEFLKMVGNQELTKKGCMIYPDDEDGAYSQKSIDEVQRHVYKHNMSVHGKGLNSTRSFDEIPASSVYPQSSTDWFQKHMSGGD